MKQEVYIELGVFGPSLMPEQITEILNIKPHTIAHKGDIIPHTQIKHKESEWTYRFLMKKPWIIANGIKKAVKLLESHPNIKDACSTYNWEIQIGIVMYLNSNCSTPIFSIKGDLLKRLAVFDASIDVDIY